VLTIRLKGALYNAAYARLEIYFQAKLENARVAGRSDGTEARSARNCGWRSIQKGLPQKAAKPQNRFVLLVPFVAIKD